MAKRVRRGSKAEVLSPVLDTSEIATRAYFRFLDRGGQHGHDVDDWLKAEREVRSALQGGMAAQKSSMAAGRTR